MNHLRWVPLAAVGLVLVVASGCGGNARYAKVSGVVNLDGKPYKNAIVSFQPLATPGNPNPGRGSTGLTDENGRYSLTTDDGHTGAVIGKHRIRIRTKVDDPMAVVDPSVGSPDDVGAKAGKKVEVEPIPSEWFDDFSTKEYVVPPEGTDKANFDIVSAPKKKK